ncbi:type IV secretion system protein VirD4 [Roseovarius tolerans]|uniref:Type IV secretion system protein VirD4 n=1 Tax=Roseovarius tolerans TaxID=74031 RepID=A0A1H8JG78_9RHOB|nr:type IV secretory system conjugative DNA transfer family protein [Roseovarius tolerans]SEN79692.1 type IV secretion system protein VirD4 [Roseovarius tolerans]
MENRPLVREVNIKSFGAVLYGTAGWALWPKGQFEPYDYGWYAMGGMLMLGGGAMAFGAARAVFSDIVARKDTDGFRKKGSGLHTAGWASDADLEKAGMFDPVEPPCGITHGGRALFGPHKLRIPHWKVLAPSGLSKTTSRVVPAVMHATLSPDRPTVVLMDLKNGEIASQCAPVLRKAGINVIIIDDRTVTKLKPTSVNPFDPFRRAYLRGDKAASMMAREIALNFVPEPSDDQKGRFWRDGEREFLTLGLLALAQYVPEDCTPTGLWRLLSSPKMLDDALKASSKGSGALGDLTTRIIARKKSNPEHYEDFLGTARRRVEIYEEGGLLEGVGVDSIFDHASIKEGNTAIFIVGSQVGGEVLAPNTMAHLSALLQATKQEPARPVRFIIDEATNSPVHSLVEEFTKLRAYGGRIEFIAQAESEIRKKFGEASAETIETQCGVKQIMGVSKIEDAERLSKTLGIGVGVAESFSASGKSGDQNRTLNDQGRALMTPSELLQMPKDEQIILIDGMPPIRCKKLSQNEIGIWGRDLAANPLEGGKLPYKPRIEITYGIANTVNTVRHLRRPRKGKASNRTHVLRPAYFLWLPVAAIVGYAAFLAEPPYLRASYTYQTGYAGRTHYQRCDYIGFTGSFTLHPPDGQCPLVTFGRG